MTPTVGWQLQIRWWKQKATMMKQNDFNETNDYDKTNKWMTMMFKLVLKKYHKIDIWLQQCTILRHSIALVQNNCLNPAVLK